ncbi:MAG: Undecaprenyl-phosphate mannosyltransferase [Pelotomaculum sp. PtaU1.Bin035]|nr:MAG: Undecaprenyl-phosphate mannosyltransferase [Pelotomaculum sp. PtaU1.Bin035]
MKKTDCLIIIPAYNEEQNISRVLQDIRKLDTDLDIVVINDGSRDKTVERVKKAGCSKVITLPYNLGYGGALQTGFKYAVNMGYQFVIQFDADGQHDPEDILTILDHLKTGIPDIVIGSRFLGRGSFDPGVMKKFAITVFRLLIKISTGVMITDPTSGLQGLTNRVFTRYATRGDYPEDYPDADTLISMIAAGYRVVEFPANIRIRHSGNSMHTGIRTIYYFVKMLVSILVVLFRNKM